MKQQGLPFTLAVGQVGRMTREQRKDEIFDVVRLAGCRVTVGYIAARTGLKVTPYLQGILEEMSEEHDLDRVKVQLSNSVEAWGYDLPGELKDNE